MVIRTIPSPLRWLIGAELARYRTEAQLSLVEASGKIGVSKPKLGHLETGRQHQGPDDIALLLKAYGAEQRDIDRLTSLTGRADESTWWAPWAQVVPDWLRTFVGLEALAEKEFTFEPVVFPGLLQTEDYAKAVTADTPRVRRDHGERFVNFRMARARRLTDGDSPLKVHAVIAEAALRLRVGSTEVRQAQLEHLVVLADLPNVTIQIIRPEDGIHSAVAGPFVLLDFELAQSIAYAELHDGAIYVQDQDQVRIYAMAAENTAQVALSPEQSVALIKSIIDTS